MSETETRILNQKMFGRTWTHYALNRHVLCVALKGEVDDWAAYIGAVPGDKHTEEAELVAKNGSKLPYWIARKLFPSMDAMYAWRE